jgi:hypothetical protein
MAKGRPGICTLACSAHRIWSHICREEVRGVHQLASTDASVLYAHTPTCSIRRSCYPLSLHIYPRSLSLVVFEFCHFTSKSKSKWIFNLLVRYHVSPLPCWQWDAKSMISLVVVRPLYNNRSETSLLAVS